MLKLTTTAKGIEGMQKENAIAKNWYYFSKSKWSVAGLIIVLFIIFIAIFAPIVSPYPQSAGSFVDYAQASMPPSLKHLFGTDPVGRDILSRIIFAYREALEMSMLVLAIVVPIGSLVGLFGGYFSDRWFGTLVMRITDIFLSIPPLILALAIAALLRPTLTNTMLAITVSWWPWYARLVYGQAASAKNEPFIKSAELIGASKLHIFFKELFPNFLSPILTKMTLDVGWIILTDASLSFVGLGVQPPAPSLGGMISIGAQYLPDYWWVAVFPALAIVFAILAFNFLGDGIHDMFLAKEV